jgi:uncharacterized protein
VFSQWIILTLLLILLVYFTISGRREKFQCPVNRFKFYIKGIIRIIVVLGIFFALDPHIYYPVDFLTIGKGVNISVDTISIIIPIFFIPFILSFTSWTKNYPKNIHGAKELFGYPISYLPNRYREYYLFVFYIISGVFFEELLCRQFMFHSLHTTLHLNADTIVVVSSLLFGIGHLYQGWKGILSNFILGLILGKVFLIWESLAYPIVLHLFLNLTITVLAFRRIKDIGKTSIDSQEIRLAE